MKKVDINKVPIIGKAIEHSRAEKRANEILKKYSFYKTEDSIQRTWDRRMELYKQRKDKMDRIKYFFAYVFLYPLSKISKLISFVSRIGMVISVFTFFVGVFDVYKYYIKCDMSVNVNKAIILIIAPFVFSLLSYVFGMLADRLWKDYGKDYE